MPAAPATPTTGAPAADASTWMTSLSTEERGWLQMKGITDPSALVQSWKGAEKLVGHPKDQLLVLPKEPKGLADYKDIFGRLGTPAKPEDYGVPVDAKNPDVAANFAKMFHDAMLTKDQAAIVMDRYAGMAKVQMEAVNAAREAKNVADKQALATKWGAAYDQNLAMARGVARKFGMTEEVINSFDKAAGHVALMEFLVKVGQGMGEHEFVDGQPGVGLMTPEQATAELERLKADPEWVRKYVNGGAAENKKMQELLAASLSIKM